ncbi:copper resistance protein NlpE N-terminal domain-containing protein [Alkalimonas sp. MEB108]|uniref:Copper resistance protein NlpE N-terminal domain-containing protein n=1 Tax=Alkalimonas cellulosilytica TaxID=3058395 RepID=A0ABU7J5X3_9GAMM|nr:copper resistance protein NlpE N-terminal domain-containing protein [Alkalimonas sp. MEB108]MEE2001886.1 copper resistance protein NlpE N-terminal domain-containing protein [Alkalimonas sp. MEB108]
MNYLPASFLVASMLLLGCAEPDVSLSADNGATAAVADAAHNSRNALDWDGRYEGVLPCADCEGIKTKLTLQQDGRYQLESQYLGKSNQVFREQGTFEWDSSGQIIQLQRPQPGGDQFFVGENRLWQLDMAGQRITGELAEQYQLHKAPPAELASAPLAGTRWQLTELMGQPLSANNPAYIVFSSTEPRVYGNAGCNRFFGSYELNTGQMRLRLSGIGMTQMACMQDTIEPEFSEVLQSFDNFNLTDDSLTLNRARMAPLARFTAAGPAEK